jgi:hypothetical protein
MAKQGLKPIVSAWSIGGPAEAVPFYKAHEFNFMRDFFSG